jgi:hypothetical protein
MKASQITKKIGSSLLILAVGLFLLVPVRVCGSTCPTCLSSQKQACHQEEAQIPACHQAQAPACHQTQASENHCSSKPDKPHQCCMKSVPSVTTNQKFIPATQTAKLNKADLAVSPNSVSSVTQNIQGIKLVLDSHHHKPKASNKLFLFTSSLLI